MPYAPRPTALPLGLVLRPLPTLRRALALLRAPGCVALVSRVWLGAAARAGRAAGAAS